MSPLLNQRGSTLEVVLIIVLILFSSLITYGMYMKESYMLYRYEDVLNRERQMEVVMRYYFREKADDGELKSGRIKSAHGQLRYRVNDGDDEYLIESVIRLPEVSYTIDMTIDKKTLAVTKFEYV